MLTAVKNFFMHKDKNERSNRWILGTILVFSFFILAVSLILSIEKFHLLQDPGATLSCSINLVLNCASVMNTPQASLLGFPNSFIGLMAAPVFITLAVGWFAGAKYKKWFMVGALLGSVVAFLFAQWLFFQSVYVIGVLCPWCLVVTVSTEVVLAAFLRYSLRENLLNLPAKTHSTASNWLAKGYDKLIFAAYVAVLTLLVLLQFPDLFS